MQIELSAEGDRHWRWSFDEEKMAGLLEVLRIRRPRAPETEAIDPKHAAARLAEIEAGMMLDCILAETGEPRDEVALCYLVYVQATKVGAGEGVGWRDQYGENGSRRMGIEWDAKSGGKTPRFKGPLRLANDALLEEGGMIDATNPMALAGRLKLDETCAGRILRIEAGGKLRGDTLWLADKLSYAGQIGAADAKTRTRDGGEGEQG